jgi:hypothetical protein
VLLFPFEPFFDSYADEVWDKFGQAIGNLQVLHRVRMFTSPDHISFAANAAELDDDDEVVTIPDSEILALILSHMRPKIQISIISPASAWRADDLRSFAQAIRGRPNITRYNDGDNFPYESLDTLFSALATLPALEYLVLASCQHQIRPEDASALAHPESLTELLRVPSLLSVSFDRFPFTRALCQAMANAFREGTGFTKLEFKLCGSMDEALSTAIQIGLGTNETLESLALKDVNLIDDNADVFSRSFSFLRTNNALKSLVVTLGQDVTESCVAAFRTDVAAMLQDNKSLESLNVQGWVDTSVRGWNAFKVEDYDALITGLQQNRTLKRLQLGHGICKLTDGEDKQMASILKKNYALESLPRIKPEIYEGDASSILRLNAAGRRYLIEDGSSIAKGVEVLSRVNNEDSINCVFLHLLENPRLCDRSAVEKVIAGERSNGRSTTPNLTASSGRGKREQAIAHKDKESRRRLA